jgi:hypothetical protein
MLFEIKKNKTGKPERVEPSTLTEQGWREKDLENYLRDNLVHLIGDDLMVIGQSRPYEPEADLTALDHFGDLWFFELKKEPTSSDNLLQVMKYSQTAAAYTIDDLDDIYSAFKGASDSLAVEFCKHFGHLSPTAAQQWGDKIGRQHHLVVIADGADEETVQAVSHWQRHGLDIQLWPYRIHPGKNGTFRLELPDLFIKGRQISRGGPGIFLVNTCRQNEPTSAMEKYMLKHQCALATCEPWVFKINRILTGSRVLLYANREGIVALGVATAEKRTIQWEEREPGRLVVLRDYKKLKAPLAADSIRKLAGKNYPLLQTVRRLPDEIGEQVWKTCLARA